MSEPMDAGFIVAPPGSTVVLRCKRNLSTKSREFVRQLAADINEKNPGVRFVFIDGNDWDVCVIGAEAPEKLTPSKEAANA